MKKAADRIAKAIRSREKIILYGDADLDGATSVVILQDAVKSLGGAVSAVYFPDREAEGYGISEKGLNLLRTRISLPALLISLDCGIGNVKEVELANKLGFEVIIIDHHQVLEKLPEAEIIVNPKQPGDKYPFKELACAGVVFKLAEALLKDKMTEALRKNFLELTAIATIADMMPRKSENRIFIDKGLPFLEDSWRPGIQAFLGAEPFKELNDINQKVGKMISILNIRDQDSEIGEKQGSFLGFNLPVCFKLLICSSFQQAKQIINRLLKKTEERDRKIKEIEAEVEKRINNEKGEPIIFQGDADFEVILMSTVASIICHRYLKPVFLYKKMAKESQGTVRTPKEIDGVSLMKKCSKYLLTYGGHARAAGFRIKNINLGKFKKCLAQNCQAGKNHEKNNHLR